LIKEACTQHIHQINLTDLKESTNFTDKLKIKGKTSYLLSTNLTICISSNLMTTLFFFLV
jgi:hypothetical protein